jgi:DMSO/TMAO reductase YedYZ molybdopterin-dependent catalytic subunit
VLKQSILSGGLWISGFQKLRWPFLASDSEFHSRSAGSQVGVVPFSEEGRVPLGEILGEELDGRLFTDLSLVSPENLVTPTSNFYIRTRASKLLNLSKPWTIRLGGLTEKLVTLRWEDIAKASRPMGLHPLECAGNARSAHFGMLSLAEWEGVPVEDALRSAKPTSAASVLISGFDHYSSESHSSVPGASWIFTRLELDGSGAFLATKMNGQPLTADHGFPVRLLVPGWYGCTCIKWVNEISFVDERAPATSQMQEYAERTMQNGAPALAADFQPATLDVAAMPIRVEKWFINGKIEFHVMGIQWGGPPPIDGLEIQFNPEEKFVPVDNFRLSPGDSWNFWKQIWTPKASGRYLIRLRPKNANVVARRLRSGYYLRSVEIVDL